MPTPSNSCSCGHRDPLHCIVPPYIADRLLDHADAEVRRIARHNLTAGATFRAIRTVSPTRTLSLLGAVQAGRYREIYDAQNRQGLPGRLVRVEGAKKSGDPAVDEAYAATGYTYDFYLAVHRRNSLDDHGLKLLSSVHVGRDFDNAFWNGTQMAFGDGDGVLFKRFTRSLDVVGHELTHGVVSYTADLVYQDESGALNEHFADVFGTLVKQWRRKQSVAKANWLIGEDLLVPARTRRAIRSLADPGNAFRDDPMLGDDPQPKHYRDRYTGAEDNGGVHTNSGIPNHAFYLAATALGGQAWKTVGPIWYQALTTRLEQTSTFTDLRDATLALGRTAGATTYRALRSAWKAVGL